MDTPKSSKNQRFTVDGREPEEVNIPESVEQLAGTLHRADEQRRAVVPTGLGAFLHLGAPPRKYDVALSLQQLNHVVDYQPTDMTVTVEAGMPLAQLQQELGAHGQWLPIDPPLPERATIGGIVAANLSGPARLAHGTIRDALLGLKAVRADGTVIKGGGKVVKNVAGYDIPKLFCGSFGTLGVIVEATFKVLPRPEAQATLAFACPTVDAAMNAVLHITGSELQPAFLEIANFAPLASFNGPYPYRLFVGFAGIAEEVQYQRERLCTLVGADGAVEMACGEEQAQSLVQTLRDFPAQGSATLRCKASLLPTKVALFCRDAEAEAQSRGLSVQLLAHAGNGIVYSRFTQLDELPPDKLISFIDWLRILTKKLAGYLVVEDLAATLKERVDVWGHVGGAFPLMKRLKDTLDPNGTLNPGRFVGGI
ncbi:MAG: FAD-binding oxidoreductase [Deltaproteobacteria bacterium]|nr:FAD-binding oxidoreductase [Deltaproteobacteria bacterium]